jgi:uncharacterized protein (TIGR04255 family)
LRSQKDCQKMQVPKKITPDNIKEAVIELRYQSDLPFEVLLGLFFNAFDDTYTYTSTPIKNKPNVPGQIGKQNKEVVINLGGQSILYNDKISIRIAPNAFVFSCLTQYIGWGDFIPEVKKALTTISETKYVEKWTRIGLRYITEYKNKDLKDCINFNFSFGLPEVHSVSTSFRSEFNYFNSKIILNLNNKIPALEQNSANPQPQIIPVSIIDIDVIKEPLEITNNDKLFEEIEDSHKKEKAIFFGMLKNEFLQTLKPQY